MIGVVPLGTGNDLARVLGWGSQCSDEERIPSILSEMECSSYRLLDRWSVQFTTDPNINIPSLVSNYTFHHLCANIYSKIFNCSKFHKSHIFPQNTTVHTMLQNS